MKYIIITSKDGKRELKFPLRTTTFAVFSGTLHISNRGVLFRFPLDRYDYRIEEKQNEKTSIHN